jgi:phospholipid/cholesterol/gamma-HCH transport system substrate-binding protein
MAENRAEVLAGAAVLAAAIGFLAWSMGGVTLTGGADSYQLTASFRSAEGIRTGSDVRLAGVKVGTITALTLNPETYYADAVIEVDAAVKLPTDSAILISSEGLLGGNFIELVPGGAEEVLVAGDEIEDTQGAVSLLTLLMKWVGSSGEDDAGAAP